MSLNFIEATPAPALPGWPLWRLGFRPFYLMAALFALCAIPLWLCSASGWLARAPALGGQAWHAHEMIFGYAVAVIAGFLLTAVKNWTGLATPSGGALAALALLWLAPRLLLPFAPWWLSQPLDLAFLPLLAWCLYRLLRQLPQRRNHFAPLLLCALALCNLGFYLALAGRIHLEPLRILDAALYLITTLAVIIAGRVLPMFTRNGLPGVRQFQLAWLERAIAPLTLLVLAADLSALPGVMLCAPNLALAALHLTRSLGWGAPRSYRTPLLWIMHLAYAWIAIAFVLAALASLGLCSWVAVHHALAVGALGGMTLGMITRTALGHSGRRLQTTRSEPWAYGAIMLAALLRLAPLLLPVPGTYFVWLWAAAAAWCCAFGLYLLKYAPILLRARADGKPG